jgi:hypothetical protein
MIEHYNMKEHEMLTPVGCNGGSRILIVDQHTKSSTFSIRIASRIGDDQLILSCVIDVPVNCIYLLTSTILPVLGHD